MPISNQFFPLLENIIHFGTSPTYQKPSTKHTCIEIPVRVHGYMAQYHIDLTPAQLALLYIPPTSQLMKAEQSKNQANERDGPE